MSSIEKTMALETSVAAPLFANIAPSSLERLSQASATEIVLDDTVIVTEGEHLPYLHIVCSGVVEMFAKAGENRATIALLGPGESFILAAVVSSAVALMSARALGRVELIHVSARVFRKLLKTDPALSRNVTAALAASFRGMVRNLRDQKLRSTNQRLAAYLLRLSREQGSSQEVILPLRKHVIASLLGMQPASLSRAFAELQILGVTVEHDRVTLASPERLETFACLHRRVDEADV